MSGSVLDAGDLEVNRIFFFFFKKVPVLRELTFQRGRQTISERTRYPPAAKCCEACQTAYASEQGAGGNFGLSPEPSGTWEPATQLFKRKCSQKGEQQVAKVLKLS